MSTVTAGLFLALVIPSAPAPKTDRGIPKELIDLLPEDTAAVVVLDGTRIMKSEFGAAVVKFLVNSQKAEEPIRVADLARDIELALITQFLIHEHAGDFCIMLRLREGSGLPKALMKESEKETPGGTAPEQIGKRMVYSLGSPDGSFTRIDDRTVMLVLANGDQKQIKATRAAAYGDREKPGPSAAIRKMLANEGADVAPIRLYGQHPTKLGYSAGLAMSVYGMPFERMVELGDKLESYRIGVRLTDIADVRFRLSMKDADAAKELLQAYEAAETDDPGVKEWRAACKAVREGEEVIITGKATRALVERLISTPNK